MSRLSSDSSDEDDTSMVLTSADPSHNWSFSQPDSDTDPGDLEVVEAEDTPQSASYEQTFSQGEESPYRINNFYNQSYDTYKNDQQEPTYSLDDPSNGDEYHNDFLKEYESSTATSSKKSKKKKEKSDRNNEASSLTSTKKKSKKRKNHSDDSDVKKAKRTKYGYEGHKEFFNSSKQPYSGGSSEKSPVADYESSHSSHSFTTDFTNTLDRIQKSPAPVLDLSEEDDELPVLTHYKINDEKPKSHKKIDKYNNAEKTDVKTRIDSSNKGNLLMKKMGYREGEGLGKNAQGRVDPVELSKQKGRRGLGLSLPGLDDGQAPEWDPTLEDISVKESIDWLESLDDDILDCQMMEESWLVTGPKNMDIENMTDFIDEELLSGILQKKSVFDNLSDDELTRTIFRSNPFETIRKSIFMNRAAVKMANMDSAFNFMFTDPRNKRNVPMVDDKDLLYFADVCAGPGGFSEYILWKKKWRAKGIGFTLKGDCDFKIQDFKSGPSETFEPYYGANDDGNIYDPENIKSLTDFVMKITDEKGVHFMMADGGFSVKGQENYQELLSKQLYLCQFLVSLCIVREEGHFVCKLFDLFSPFSAGLIYLIHRAYDQVCIFKPNTSRPANSERYIICKHKKRNIDDIRQYLFHINERMWKLGSGSELDVLECVPVDVMRDNTDFFTYLQNSNNRLGNKQLVSLDKVIAYFKDPNLHEPQQNSLRKQCADAWKIPLGPRRMDQSTELEICKNQFKHVLGKKFRPELVSETLNLKGKKLVPENLKEMFNFSILDWECVPLGSEKLIFVLGLGKNKVYHWTGSRWEYEEKVHIELPHGTLLYGEFVPEFEGEGMKQKKIMAFHIVDGLTLGDEVISNFHYEKRREILNLFVKALKKYKNNTLCPIRVKSPRDLKDINQICNSVISVRMKTGSYEICLKSLEYNHNLQMKGICFIRTTQGPWHKHRSKTSGNYYYYDKSAGVSRFEQDRPNEAVASAINALQTQVLWMWEPGVGFKGEPRYPNVLHRRDLLQFIQSKASEL